MHVTVQNLIVWLISATLWHIDHHATYRHYGDNPWSMLVKREYQIIRSIDETYRPVFFWQRLNNPEECNLCPVVQLAEISRSIIASKSRRSNYFQGVFGRCSIVWIFPAWTCTDRERFSRARCRILKSGVCDLLDQLQVLSLSLREKTRVSG